jgi:hypothetical protein
MILVPERVPTWVAQRRRESEPPEQPVMQKREMNAKSLAIFTMLSPLLLFPGIFLSIKGQTSNVDQTLFFHPSHRSHLPIQD